MKTTAATLTLVAALLSSPLAVAQGHESAGDGDAWTPVKHLRFTDEDVRAGLLGPDGELIEVVARVPQPSLIELREGFEAEVVKTMEDM
jgi:hypothetical protein